MTLLGDFRDEARRRGALAADEGVTLASAFRVVRDMPWGEASDLRPETAIVEWRGTGREKHLLLAALFGEMGYDTGLLAITLEYAPGDPPWLPAHLAAATGGAPVPDVTLLLRVQPDANVEEWSTVDATWPLATQTLGLPVNEEFVPGRDQRIGCLPVEIFHLDGPLAHDPEAPEPEGDDPPPDPAETRALVERILRDHVGDAPGAIERRARFIAALADWLAAATGDVR